MKNPIIPIRRVHESWILVLIKIGILVITEDGLHAADTEKGSRQIGGLIHEDMQCM